jgi:hypothetical protein
MLYCVQAHELHVKCTSKIKGIIKDQYVDVSLIVKQISEEKNTFMSSLSVQKPEPEFVNVYGAQQSISRNRFVVFVVPARQATQAGGIRFLESITGLLNVYKFGLCRNM